MAEERIAILGDVHANIDALNAVVEDARAEAVTTFHCVGDVVGYNANPQECVDLIRSICTVVVRGNHDHYCSHDVSLSDFQPNAAIAIEWTRKQINEESVKWLANLPMTKTFFQQSFSIVHATLDMPEQWGYVFDAFDAAAHFTYQPTPLCFHGHTHCPMIYEKQMGAVYRIDAQDFTLHPGRKYFINVGSVGQPRDGDPRAAYLLYDPQERKVRFRRVPYDIAAAQAKVREAGLPERLAERLSFGQ